ncbi:hypothetical protein [Reichenbachiella versicolor]|uniref:hypothetical protein n=1 Tax=Reichenbachiella versicolor TaxID=1821036 RepID=UPI001C88096F|nr:hypothetical protein [Reichenbachiella versicolor]
MKNILKYSVFAIGFTLMSGCGTQNSKTMNTPKFVEITVQSHIILHGFDENNKEIIEEVEVEKPIKKLLQVDRIQSISEKYILTSYGFGRLVFWEYKGSYPEMKALLMGDGME